MITAPDIDVLLGGPLGRWLDEQTLVRQQAKKLAMDRWWKVAIIGGPLLIFAWVLLPISPQFKAIATAAAASLGYAWGNAPRKKAVKQVKEGINQAIARSLNLEYSPDVQPGQPFDLGRRYGLLPSYDRSGFEDLWHGNLGTRRFSLHEAHLQEERGSGKNRHWVTVFRGVVMSIDFSREFRGTTLIERASRHRSFFGGRKDSITLDGKRLDFVDMVHPGFDDEFCLFSDDQVEARYLVHPQYVERLLAVQSAFAGRDIRALFSGGDLVLIVETENMFESGSIEAGDDRSRIQRTVEQFTSLANLASTLNERERAA